MLVSVVVCLVVVLVDVGDCIVCVGVYVGVGCGVVGMVFFVCFYLVV